jgi:hypothetical protein
MIKQIAGNRYTASTGRDTIEFKQNLFPTVIVVMT